MGDLRSIIKNIKAQQSSFHMKVSTCKESASAHVRLTFNSLNLRTGRDLGSVLPHGDLGHLTDLAKDHPAWKTGSYDQNLLTRPFRDRYQLYFLEQMTRGFIVELAGPKQRACERGEET